MSTISSKYPPFWQGCPELVAMWEAFSTQTDALRDVCEDFKLQVNIDTAGWSLPLWEQQLALPLDPALDDDGRRKRILAKLRGSGTTTVEAVEAVARSYAPGGVEVAEHPREWRIEINFTGQMGVPPLIEDLTAALEEILPAHLLYDYVFYFRKWDALRAYTWQQLQSATWADIRGGAL